MLPAPAHLYVSETLSFFTCCVSIPDFTYDYEGPYHLPLPFMEHVLRVELVLVIKYGVGDLDKQES
jgi:hypothetical protein